MRPIFCLRMIPKTGSHFSGSCAKSPHARDLAAHPRVAHPANARNRLADRLDDDRHVKGICMHETVATRRDCNMAAPEDEIAALELEKPRLVIDRCAKRALLHVTVARAWHAAS